MVAFNFERAHAAKILSGEKCVTIRRKRRCKPGDTLQLYTGMRTKRVKLLKVTECVAVEKVTIHRGGIDGLEMDLEEFLAIDGYEGMPYPEFAALIEKKYGLPCSGYMVMWKA